MNPNNKLMHQWIQVEELCHQYRNGMEGLFAAQAQDREENRLLSFLKLQPEIKTSQIGFLLNLHPHHLDDLLSNLEQKQYIVRQASQEDPEDKIVCLTLEGTAAASEIISVDARENLFNCLEDTEKEVFSTLLAKISEGIRQQLASNPPADAEKPGCRHRHLHGAFHGKRRHEWREPSQWQFCREF